MGIKLGHFYLGSLLACLLIWTQPAAATSATYIGLTLGPAKTSANDEFDLNSGDYLFVGIQTEHYLTFEFGITHFNGEIHSQAKKTAVFNHFSLSALGHLPISDSSLFARIGVNGYQYFDNNDQIQNVTLPTVGAGFDYGILPRLTIRMEWQRYIGFEINQTRSDIQNVRLGMLYYF